MNELMQAVSIEALLAARDNYVTAVHAAQADVNQALQQYAKFSKFPPSLELRVGGQHIQLDDARYTERWVAEVDRAAWRHLFDRSGIKDVMSSNQRDKLSDMLDGGLRWDRQDKEGVPTLTLENIEATFGTIYEKVGEMFNECVEEVYRTLSWNHKTNSPAAFTQKMILSSGADSWYGLSGWRIRHDANRIFDLERVVCRLANILQPDRTCGVRQVSDYPFGEWVEGNYGDKPAPFKFKGHKSGTLHIVIHDHLIVDEMNRIMADRYPGCIAKKKR